MKHQMLIAGGLLLAPDTGTEAGGATTSVANEQTSEETAAQIAVEPETPEAPAIPAEQNGGIKHNDEPAEPAQAEEAEEVVPTPAEMWAEVKTLRDIVPALTGRIVALEQEKTGLAAVFLLEMQNLREANSADLAKLIEMANKETAEWQEGVEKTVEGLSQTVSDAKLSRADFEADVQRVEAQLDAIKRRQNVHDALSEALARTGVIKAIAMLDVAQLGTLAKLHEKTQKKATPDTAPPSMTQSADELNS